MTHQKHFNCKYLVVRCIDFRLTSAISKYLEKRGISEGDYDLFALAGGVQALNSPENQPLRDFFLKQVGISAEKHNMQEVMLINHTDCAAYGGTEAFASTDEEENFHIQELNNARKIILEKYPSLGVSLTLARVITSENSWETSLKEV